MVYIKINKKYVKAILAIVLILSLGLNIYSYSQSVNLKNKYDQLVCISNQFYQANIITFVTTTQESDNPSKTIEIFDVVKGEVVKRVEANLEIQEIAGSYLNEITGMYVKVKAFPDKGYIIRIPLKPPVKVQSHWLKDFNIKTVDEVFVLFPKEGAPYLMVLDEKARPIFYNFKGNIDVLIKKLDFPL